MTTTTNMPLCYTSGLHIPKQNKCCVKTTKSQLLNVDFIFCPTFLILTKQPVLHKLHAPVASGNILRSACVIKLYLCAYANAIYLVRRGSVLESILMFWNMCWNCQTAQHLYTRVVMTTCWNPNCWMAINDT